MLPRKNNYKRRFYNIQKLKITRSALYICKFTLIKSVKKILNFKTVETTLLHYKLESTKVCASTSPQMVKEETHGNIYPNTHILYILASSKSYKEVVVTNTH